MKRITSIFMVLAMLFTLAPMNIMAEEAQQIVFSDMADTDYYAEAATALAESDILSGYPDGTFGAEKSVTRAEMAAIVCRTIDKEADSEEAKGETDFADVASDHWASGYINIASEEGIINGYGDGTFLPEASVKFEEAIKMIVCALDFAEDIEIDAEDWSKAYIDVANENGILEGLKGTKGEAATRGDIAVMTYAAIEVAIEAESVASGTPVASIPEGTYTSSQKVALSSSVEGATIYYTTNGKEPTTKSKKYVKEISVTKTTTLKAIAVVDGEVVGDVMTVVYTIKGNAAGAGGGWMVRHSIISAQMAVNGTAASVANVGDTLTLITEPADATGTYVWTIGGKKIENAAASYTVTSFDMGKTIKAEITGEGIYAGTLSDECTVSKTTEVTAGDIMTNDADKSPVVLANISEFVDDEGNNVTVDPTATLTLTIENPEKTEEEVSAANSIVVQNFVTNNTEMGVTEEALSDVTTVAVDVDLSVNETKVHPVGDVTVTLSASQLGLPDDADLANYTFSASHTNKNNENEFVDGVVVTIDNVQYVRFELNGLSTIWIGNIPPRTVTFYNTEADADNKVNSIGSVVVKFGDLTPTKQIPTPSLSGYLFCGWNYDMTRTPIISNLEVHPIWVEGVRLDADKISAILSEDVSELTPEISDGLVSLECDKGTSLPSDLTMKVTVYPPVNAAKYYVGTDAAVVAAFNDTDKFTAANDGDISFEVNVTDTNGIVVPSGTTYYYKWIDENGNVIALNAVKASIANGADTATSMEYTANVNRGVGKFEAYLIDSDTNADDYVAYINNHLNGNAIGGYTLNTNVSFDGYRVDYNLDAYDTLKFVFTPFEGESYSNSDVIEANGEYYTNNTWNENWTGRYIIENGKLVVTYNFNAAEMTDDWASATITVNGVDQLIDINWDGGSYSEEPETVDCATWAEAVNAINNAGSDRLYTINCTDSSAITLSSSLTIPANVDVYLRNCTGFTVANGATLTLTDDNIYNTAASLSVRNGDLIVEDGAKVAATFAGRDDGSRWYPSLSASNIIFKSGSELSIPDDCLISMHPYNNSESEKSVLAFESGSTVNNYGNFNATNFDTINIDATFKSTRYTYFYSDEININGQIDITADDYDYFELYGTVTIGENASVVVDNIGNKYRTNLEIYGPLTNKGYIEIKGMANAEIMNNGFANYNMGTISVASGCTIYTSGTKYINTGVITGGGTLSAALGDDYTNYDDGTEWVDVDNDEYWDDDLGEYYYAISDYSRYKYTHDPATTVDVTLYLSEVINMGEGQCDLYVDADAFPEK